MADIRRQVRELWALACAELPEPEARDLLRSLETRLNTRVIRSTIPPAPDTLRSEQAPDTVWAGD